MWGKETWRQEILCCKSGVPKPGPQGPSLITWIRCVQSIRSWAGVPGGPGLWLRCRLLSCYMNTGPHCEDLHAQINSHTNGSGRMVSGRPISKWSFPLNLYESLVLKRDSEYIVYCSSRSIPNFLVVLRLFPSQLPSPCLPKTILSGASLKKTRAAANYPVVVMEMELCV